MKKDPNEFKLHYIDWRNTRLATLKKYFGDEFFKDKTLLELGCGHGDLGNMLHKLGADVTCSDARQEHVNIVKQRYPHLKTRVDDLDKPLQTTTKYDIILHFGLLYHLNDINANISDMSKYCDYMLLETEVCDSLDPNMCIKTKEAGYDQAFNSVGSRPSPAFVERALTEAGFHYTLVKDPTMNSSFHKYDWEHKNDGTWTQGYRRFWVCYRL